MDGPRRSTVRSRAALLGTTCACMVSFGCAWMVSLGPEWPRADADQLLSPEMILFQDIPIVLGPTGAEGSLLTVPSAESPN